MARLIEGVRGHEATWTNLITQLRAGRLPHALAFVGPSGIGKKKTAWALAQALVCEGESAPCGACPSCRRMERQQSESALFIEPEKNTIRLESAQRILEFLSLRQLGRARVVIVDEAQMLNPQAANALLKIIEEPPTASYFILISSESSQLLPTLRSRLQIVRFMPLADPILKTLTGETPDWILRSARGSVTRLESFQDPDFQELREHVVQFVISALQGRREGLETLVQQAKDRDSGWRVPHLLQQILRDWSLGEQAEWIHSDLKARFQSFDKVPPPRRLELWRRAVQMEADLHAHVDRTLLFENFYGQARHALD